MTVYAAKRNPNRCPAHPGELLRDDILPAIKMRKTEIADAIGISRKHLYDMVRGSGIAGGQNMTVRAGDYVQIPAGMPHMFVPPKGTKMRYVVFNTRQ
jgi:hypothetical protein